MDRKSKEVLHKISKAKSEKDLHKIKKEQREAKQKGMIKNYQWLFVTVASAISVALIIITVVVFTTRNTSTATPEIPTQTKAVVETTLGKFTIELNEDAAPSVTSNYKTNIEKAYYKGSFFNRIVAGGILQGGVPQGAEGPEGGRPGYLDTINKEPSNLTHDKWAVAMAKTGTSINKTQFYICLSEQKSLDGEDTVFGKVIDGFDVIEKLASVEVENQGENNYGIATEETSKPKKLDQVKIVDITIAK